MEQKTLTPDPAQGLSWGKGIILNLFPDDPGRLPARDYCPKFPEGHLTGDHLQHRHNPLLKKIVA